jgi:ArsR family transcriptional regulator, zinc-responsive transcriptional repressor
MKSEEVATIDRESSTMSTTQTARKRRTPLTAEERPIVSARRGERLEEAARLLREVSNPTRLRILLALADGQKSTSQICERLGQSAPKASHHLALLRASRVVDSHREGQEIRYELTERGSRFLNSTFGLLDEVPPVPKPGINKTELKKLIKKVGTAVDDPEDWLNTPNPRFEGRRPIDLIGTDDEIRVHLIIEAAQQGFFS